MEQFILAICILIALAFVRLMSTRTSSLSESSVLAKPQNIDVYPRINESAGKINYPYKHCDSIWDKRRNTWNTLSSNARSFIYSEQEICA